jgi:hypothetical protein
MPTVQYFKPTVRLPILFNTLLIVHGPKTTPPSIAKLHYRTSAWKWVAWPSEYFWQVFHFVLFYVGDNLFCILYFNVTCMFNKCISHDGLTKFWPFTPKCEYQGIMKLIKTSKSFNFLKLILTNSVFFFFHVTSLFKDNDTCIKLSNFFNFHQDLVW